MLGEGDWLRKEGSGGDIHKKWWAFYLFKSEIDIFSRILVKIVHSRKQKHFFERWNFHNNFHQQYCASRAIIARMLSILSFKEFDDYFINLKLILSNIVFALFDEILRTLNARVQASFQEKLLVKATTKDSNPPRIRKHSLNRQRD